MRRTSFDGWPCSIARTVDILGDGWTLLVLRDVFYGESRFDGFIDSLGIARNTAQSRLKRLLRSGVLQAAGREVDLDKVGYDVVAFITIVVTHRELDGVIGALRLIPQVLEVHEISGRGDLWCRVVATDTHNLQSALRSVLRTKGVIRTETVLALHTHIPYRTEPLMERLAGSTNTRSA